MDLVLVLVLGISFTYEGKAKSFATNSWNYTIETVAELLDFPSYWYF